MPEYINKEEYCENYCRCSNEHCDRQSCPIWEAPAADVAPVVRCKDCQNLRQSGTGWWCCEYGGTITPQDYCSRAERITNTAEPQRVRVGFASGGYDADLGGGTA